LGKISSASLAKLMLPGLLPGNVDRSKLPKAAQSLARSTSVSSSSSKAAPGHWWP